MGLVLYQVQYLAEERYTPQSEPVTLPLHTMRSTRATAFESNIRWLYYILCVFRFLQSLGSNHIQTL